MLSDKLGGTWDVDAHCGDCNGKMLPGFKIHFLPWSQICMTKAIGTLRRKLS